MQARNTCAQAKPSRGDAAMKRVLRAMAQELSSAYGRTALFVHTCGTPVENDESQLSAPARRRCTHAGIQAGKIRLERYKPDLQVAHAFGDLVSKL